MGRWTRLWTTHAASCQPTTSLFQERGGLEAVGFSISFLSRRLPPDHSRGLGTEERRKFQVSCGASGSILARQHPEISLPSWTEIFVLLLLSLIGR